MAITLRPYQEQMLDAIEAGLVGGSNRLLARAATGLGKTVTFAALPSKLRAWLEQFPANHRKMLVIAHREELLDQAVEKIRAANPGLMVMVEQGDRHASPYADVVVASIQTLAATKFRRLKNMVARTTFRIVIVDEAHHSAASTYRTALALLGFLPMADASDKENIEAATHDDVALMTQALAGWDITAPKDRLLLGVTATPNRSDAIGLGCVFQSICYSYDLKAAINDQWLVPIEPWAIETTTSLDEVRMNRGDFNQRELADAVNNPHRNRLGLAAWRDHADGVPTLGFTVDVAHAHEMARVFNGDGIRAAAVSGETPKDDRRQMLRAFSEGTLDVLFNCMVLTEGTDLPRAGCILHLKPTKSATLFEQMCLDSETEILTDAGWKGIDDDLAHTQIAAFDMSNSTVHWSPLLDRIERPRGLERMWGIESPHLNVRVTGGHRMIVSTRGDREWHVRQAENLPQECRIPLCGTDDTIGPEASITDDDLAFLGLLLTDGNYSPSNGGISIFQSDRYPWVVDLIENTLTRIGVKYTRSCSVAPSNFGPRLHPLNRWTVSRGRPRGRDGHLRGWGYLERWVSSDAKRLTAAYERLSARQLRVLLTAMHAGDGLKRGAADWEPRSLSICANPFLADQVQSLAVRRGVRCNIAPRTERLVMLHISFDRPWWTVTTSASDDRPVWSMMPSSPDELVWCVTVDTGAIVTRRKGKVAVVGNTGRGLRLYPGKEKCIVIDLVDVARRHSLQTAPVLYGLPPGLMVKGKRLDVVADELETLLEEHPNFDIAGALADGGLTVEQLGAKASQVDLWSVPSLGAFGIGRAMNWIKIGPDTYRLQYPWGDGTEVIQVSRDLIDKWEVVVTLSPRDGGSKRQRTIAAQVMSDDEAAGLAEAFILAERRSVTKLKDKDAPWRSRPASPKQIALLQRLKVPAIPKGCTMGQASDLIDVAQMRRKR